MWKIGYGGTPVNSVLERKRPAGASSALRQTQAPLKDFDSKKRRGWKDDSAVKNWVYCSYRGPKFRSQYLLLDSSQLPKTLASEYPVLSSGHGEHLHTFTETNKNSKEHRHLKSNTWGCPLPSTHANTNMQIFQTRNGGNTCNPSTREVEAGGGSV